MYPTTTNTLQQRVLSSSSRPRICRSRLRSGSQLVQRQRQRRYQSQSVVGRAYFPDRETIDDDSSAILDRHLALFDEYASDGTLTRDALRTVMQSVGTEVVPMNWLTDQDIDAAMDAYDKNGDGVISREEFQAMAKDNVFLLRSLADYREIFDRLDTGKNGMIGPTELFRYFEDSKCGDGVGSFDRTERLLNKYDLNNDGQIEFSEFLRLCRYESVLPLEEILCYVTGGGAGAPAAAAAPPTEKRVSTLSLDQTKVHVLKSPEEFEEIMAGVAETTLVVLFASLTWCRPCKKLQPQMEKMAAAYGEACDVVFLKIYGNESDALKTFFKDRLKVRVTPSVFIFRGGQLLESTTGATATKHEMEMRKALGSRAADVPMMYP